MLPRDFFRRRQPPSARRPRTRPSVEALEDRVVPAGDAGFRTTLWADFQSDSGWGKQLVGDFDGDGKDDVANYYTSQGEWWVSRSTGSGFRTSLWADYYSTKGWATHLVGDFDGDGKDDIASYFEPHGEWWIARSTGSGFRKMLWADFQSNSGWGRHLVGDFDGDGNDDIANYYSSQGEWWVARSTGSGFRTTLWADFYTNSGWERQLVGDFDGDGKDDIANYYPTQGEWWVARSTGSGFRTTLWADYESNTGWGKHLVGDFDGDGRDDVASYHTPQGEWWAGLSSGSRFKMRLMDDFYSNDGWGAQLAGDFDGDGLDDVANFYTALGEWWVSPSTVACFDTTLWADFQSNSGWGKHLVGDFDGDGVDDVANFYTSLGEWWVSASTAEPVETSATAELTVEVTVDLGQDLGQVFGSLFELRNAHGEVVAGAGFQGLYNTVTAANRMSLHLYAKSEAVQTQFERETLPRVSADSGSYLFELDGTLYARSHGSGSDDKVYEWDESAREWVMSTGTLSFAVEVAGRVLGADGTKVYYDGDVILDVGPAGQRIRAIYYANGLLYYRVTEDGVSNQIVAAPWKPGDAAVNVGAATRFNLRSLTETTYSFGQLRNEVLVTTNLGGVYRHSLVGWSVLREPNGVSYQIYSALNYYDSLLLGQYPTGNLYKYDGRSLKLLAGWPPVMSGVATTAREAQSLAIYGGDLYVGVWPWGELWRYDPDRCGWLFAGRMFTHPAPTAATEHPYEKETLAVDPVGNAWGQRVPTLLPLGGSLYVSTSAKSSKPWDPKFAFLGGGKWQEYGAVHQLTLPGHLTVAPEWVDGPTTFTFTISGSTLRVSQDGVELGEVTFDRSLRLALSTTGISWATGIYGDFRGAMLSRTVSLSDG